MGMEFIKRPLWTEKLSNDKLLEFLDALNEFELRGSTENDLLLDTAETWYLSSVGIERINKLASDVYKEAARRWYEKQTE